MQYTSAGLGALVGPIGAGAIIDATGSYTVAIVGAIFISLVATFSVLPLWRLGRDSEPPITRRALLSEPSVWLVSPRTG